MATLLVDNYDSFTYNVYQLLCQLGAHVVVYRNDEITLEQAIQLNPRNIVISPGPGYPSSAGISNVILEYFQGKIPILGVCLGEQCIFEFYNGVVSKCGEIVHGKTTCITHDGKGLFEDVDQYIECTRYHSLSGDPKTCPKELVITCTTSNGIVMGVRHTKYIIEGVQFHPESIASEAGHQIFQNFLQWNGGTWDNLVKTPIKPFKARIDSEEEIGKGISLLNLSKLNSTSTSSSILLKIKNQRLKDVEKQKKIPGRSIHDLERNLKIAPPSIDFKKRLEQSIEKFGIAVLAEIKRASPSKGDIALGIHAPSQALLYSMGGAAAISVLTEPTWFKGTMQDLNDIRRAVDSPSRPAILCKDFILSEYQILEARNAGADSVLLIVAILSQHSLVNLLEFSRKLGMEPLVEVATFDELERAIEANAQIIGVNNRDLNTFHVDMNRTTDLAKQVPKGIILLALSGIFKKSDISPYISAGAKGVLVGQGLMESPHPPSTIQHFLRPIIKICGITSTVDAELCKEATHLGLIFAESPRKIDPAKALEISKKTDKTLVGVFMNQTPEFINSIDFIDIIQIHSWMSNDDLEKLQKPIWYVITFSTMDEILKEINRVKHLCLGFLLDVPKGQKTPWSVEILNSLKSLGYSFIVAGNLCSENIKDYMGFGGIDICSSVEETKGIKSPEKIKQLFKTLKVMS